MSFQGYSFSRSYILDHIITSDQCIKCYKAKRSHFLPFLTFWNSKTMSFWKTDTHSFEVNIKRRFEAILIKMKSRYHILIITTTLIMAHAHAISLDPQELLHRHCKKRKIGINRGIRINLCNINNIF